MDDGDTSHGHSRPEESQHSWSSRGLLGLLILGALAVVAAIWLVSKRPHAAPWHLLPPAVPSTGMETALPPTLGDVQCPSSSWNTGERT